MPEEAPRPENRNCWRTRAGLALLGLAAALFLGTAVRAGWANAPQSRRFTAGERSVTRAAAAMPDGWLSVNDAEMEDLIQLKGIGETIAALIIDEREQNGYFHYPEDLLSVKGIGPVKLSQIREELNFSIPEEE